MLVRCLAAWLLLAGMLACVSVGITYGGPINGTESSSDVGKQNLTIPSIEYKGKEILEEISPEVSVASSSNHQAYHRSRGISPIQGLPNTNLYSNRFLRILAESTATAGHRSLAFTSKLKSSQQNYATRSLKQSVDRSYNLHYGLKSNASPRLSRFAVDRVDKFAQLMDMGGCTEFSSLWQYPSSTKSSGLPVKLEEMASVLRLKLSLRSLSTINAPSTSTETFAYGNSVLGLNRESLACLEALTQYAAKFSFGLPRTISLEYEDAKRGQDESVSERLSETALPILRQLAKYMNLVNAHFLLLEMSLHARESSFSDKRSNDYFVPQTLQSLLKQVSSVQKLSLNLAISDLDRAYSVARILAEYISSNDQLTSISVSFNSPHLAPLKKLIRGIAKSPKAESLHWIQQSRPEVNLAKTASYHTPSAVAAELNKAIYMSTGTTLRNLTVTYQFSTTRKHGHDLERFFSLLCSPRVQHFTFNNLLLDPESVLVLSHCIQRRQAMAGTYTTYSLALNTIGLDAGFEVDLLSLVNNVSAVGLDSSTTYLSGFKLGVSLAYAPNDPVRVMSFLEGLHSGLANLVQRATSLQSFSLHLDSYCGQIMRWSLNIPSYFSSPRLVTATNALLSAFPVTLKFLNLEGFLLTDSTLATLSERLILREEKRFRQASIVLTELSLSVILPTFEFYQFYEKVIPRLLIKLYNHAVSSRSKVKMFYISTVLPARNDFDPFGYVVGTYPMCYHPSRLPTVINSILRLFSTQGDLEGNKTSEEQLKSVELRETWTDGSLREHLIKEQSLFYSNQDIFPNGRNNPSSRQVPYFNFALFRQIDLDDVSPMYSKYLNGIPVNLLRDAGINDYQPRLLHMTYL